MRYCELAHSGHAYLLHREQKCRPWRPSRLPQVLSCLIISQVPLTNTVAVQDFLSSWRNFRFFVSLVETRVASVRTDARGPS